jgi:hypothetical protein
LYLRCIAFTFARERRTHASTARSRAHLARGVAAAAPPAAAASSSAAGRPRGACALPSALPCRAAHAARSACTREKKKKKTAHATAHRSRHRSRCSRCSRCSRRHAQLGLQLAQRVAQRHMQALVL